MGKNLGVTIKNSGKRNIESKFYLPSIKYSLQSLRKIIKSVPNVHNAGYAQCYSITQKKNHAKYWRYYIHC